MGEIDVQWVLMRLLALLIAIPVHEFAHALSAVNNGDDGPRRAGRLSIMPQDHFDPIGAIFCVITTISGFGLGWGKPVLVNPGMLNNPRWDLCKITAWGPFSNFLLAIGFALPVRFGLVQGSMATLLLVFVMVNLGLCLFNLIPLGPLDGAKIVEAFLPPHLGREWGHFNEQYGFFMLFGLIFFGQPIISAFIGPGMSAFLQLALGVPMG